jgi:hypothetical protein
MGPVLEGAGLNITVLSYCGSVDFGFAVASDAVPDVWTLARCVEPACAELLAAARRKTGYVEPPPAEATETTANIRESGEVVSSRPSARPRRPSARAKA